MASDIPRWAVEMAEAVAKEATRDAMRDPLMPYYITVAPHIARALIEAEARGAERMKERAAEVIEGYPPDGFNAALYERTERHDEHDPFWKFEGDTGNWAALMGEVLKPFATAIRNLETKDAG